MSASLSLLWGLMNTMQIIIHLKLYDVIIPANALMILSFMEELGNFKLGKLIPIDKILPYIVDISDSLNPKTNPEMQSLEYDSSNLFKNLGFLILFFISLSIIIVTALLLSFLSRFSPL